VDKVRSVTSLNVLGSQFERRSLGGVSLSAGDSPGVNHGLQDQVAAVERALRTPVGRKIAGWLDQAGPKSGLRQRKFFQILAEVSLRGFTKARNRERTALSHVNLVGVELENLLFGEALLQFDGDQDLGHLALELLFRREKEAAGHLHGDG